jgi:hypothetical protein
VRMRTKWLFQKVNFCSNCSNLYYFMLISFVYVNLLSLISFHILLNTNLLI